MSWKLANFARLDPALKRRNIAGATHGAAAEVEVWNEFNDNWERLAFESEELLRKITGQPPEPSDEVEQFPEGRTRAVLVRTRVNQGFFRAAILAAYSSRCCITGLSIASLLSASHIVPWAVDVKNRTNPRNGLCLNAIHDRAFDCGLLSVTPDLRVKISLKAKAAGADKGAQDFLWRFYGARVLAPRRFAPDEAFLRYHNEHVFVGRL